VCLSMLLSYSAWVGVYTSTPSFSQNSHHFKVISVCPAVASFFSSVESLDVVCPPSTRVCQQVQMAILIPISGLLVISRIPALFKWQPTDVVNQKRGSCLRNAIAHQKNPCATLKTIVLDTWPRFLCVLYGIIS